MSDHASLLLDVGNTSIKYTWYYPEQHIADLQIMRTTLDSVSALISQAQQVVFCSVGKEATATTLTHMAEQHHIPIYRASTLAKQFGITNAYHTPSNMGTDRWMAIIAGGALSHRNYLVVDAGTAITCDMVVNQQHVGGWIAPGLHMAKQTVVNNTQKVFNDDVQTYHLQVGDNTPECVTYGALAQLTGMLIQAKLFMLQHDSGFDVYISGGDAVTLIQAESQRSSKKLSVMLPHQLGTTNYIENIVLIGLARLVQEHIVRNA